MQSQILPVLRMGVLGVWVAMTTFCYATGIVDTSLSLTYYNRPTLITSMAYGNGTFVGVGDGMTYLSHDGSNWNVYLNGPMSGDTTTIVFGSGGFLMFGYNPNTSQPGYYFSTNGFNWMPLYSTDGATPYTNSVFFSAAACDTNGRWVLIGPNYNKILTATISLQTNTTTSHAVINVIQEYQSSFKPYCITYANGNFVLGANNGGASFFTSTDGINWLYKSTLPVGNGQGSPIVFGNNTYVTTTINFDAGGVLVYRSSDLVTWDYTKILNYYQNNYLLPLIFVDGKFVFSTHEDVFGNSHTYSSPDAWAWQPMWTNHTQFAIYTMTYGQGKLVVSDMKSIFQTEAFTTETNPPPATLSLATYSGVTINGSPGGVYQIQCSTNLGSPWMALTNFYLPSSPYIWVDTSAPVEGKRFYQSIQLR